MATKKVARPFSGEDANSVRTACDCIGEALAHCRQQDDRDTIDLLLPALAQLWRVRWEHQLHADRTLQESGAA